MSVTSRVSSQVDSQVRARGREYFLDGAVRLTEGDATHVRARVRGTESYEVAVQLGGGALYVGCTCPYFSDRLQTCKHIWATLMAADGDDYLRAAASARALRVVPDEDFIEHD